MNAALPHHEWLPPEPAQPGAPWALRLGGDWRAARAPLRPPPRWPAEGLRVDGSGLTAWDGTLAAALREQLAPLAQRGVPLQLDALPPDVRAVVRLALPAAAAAPAGGSEREGRGGMLALPRFLREAARTVAFVGEAVFATLRLFTGRAWARGFSLAELWRQIDQTGARSLPVVALACGLIGLMLAYMGGAQLNRMGGQTYIADVVTVGMVRELAGLFTGVILAGRVGSAFAAQLATMQAGEEIDALRVLGIDPFDHLVLPRLLALVVVAPLAMAYGALTGVMAGALPATLAFGLPLAEYLGRCMRAITWTHLWIGLFKCVLYGALLSLAGCREGLAAGRNAQAVGEATTTAVVKGLVWIFAAAAGTTVVLQSLGF